MTQTHKLYLSAEELAQQLGFSVRTITSLALKWRESGGKEGIPAFKVGRSWRFNQQEMYAYLDRKQLPLVACDSSANPSS